MASIRSGIADHVLVVGSETLSRITDWTDRNTCVLFGDGAGAVVLSLCREQCGVMAIELGSDAEMAIGVVVKSNFALVPAGQCTGNDMCGHIHMKIDPEGDTCNIPGRTYNSMNSDFGGDLIEARFGHCPNPQGTHVIGILLADQDHNPIIVDGKPITALVTVTTTAAK